MVLARDLLSPARVQRRGVFDPVATTRLLDRFYGGDEGIWRLVCTLFVFEGWASEVLDTSSAALEGRAA